MNKAPAVRPASFQIQNGRVAEFRTLTREMNFNSRSRLMTRAFPYPFVPETRTTCSWQFQESCIPGKKCDFEYKIFTIGLANEEGGKRGEQKKSVNRSHDSRKSAATRISSRFIFRIRREETRNDSQRICVNRKCGCQRISNYGGRTRMRWRP